MSFTAKSLVLDIADNYGGNEVSIRSIDFYLNGSLVTRTSEDFASYATSFYSASYAPWRVFDTSLSKTGIYTNNSWTSTTTTSQRLIIISPPEFDKIVVNNGHHNGGNTNFGAKNVVITLSSDEITSTVYNDVIPNGTVIFNGTFKQHSTIDEVDPETLPLSVTGASAIVFTAKSVIFDIADDWGGLQSYMAIRAIDFWLSGNKITMTSGFTAYATSHLGSNVPANAFNTSLTKTGIWVDNSWLTAVGQDTNQRLVIVFDTPLTFDSIRVNNGHYEGGQTADGARNVVITITPDLYNSTTYNNTVPNGTVLFAGEFAQHTNSDIADPQTLNFTVGAVSFEFIGFGVTIGGGAAAVLSEVNYDVVGLGGAVSGGFALSNLINLLGLSGVIAGGSSLVILTHGITGTLTHPKIDISGSATLENLCTGQLYMPRSIMKASTGSSGNMSLPKTMLNGLGDTLIIAIGKCIVPKSFIVGSANTSINAIGNIKQKYPKLSAVSFFYGNPSGNIKQSKILIHGNASIDGLVRGNLIIQKSRINGRTPIDLSEKIIRYSNSCKTF